MSMIYYNVTKYDEDNNQSPNRAVDSYTQKFHKEKL